MKNNKLDDEFIKIINAKVTNKELIDYILYLEKAKILNKIEINFCDLIIEQLEMFNTIDYKQICQNLKITNYQELQFYDGNELPNKIDEFIKNRKKIAREKIFKDVKENGIKATTKSLTQLFFERYSRMIDIKEDNETFKKLENISKDAYDKNDYSISSAIQLVDNLTNGLKGGTITSIIGGNNDVKSLWAINIAYKNLLQNKNVLYIAIKYLKQDIYTKLLSRHSCNKDKFEKEFTFSDELNDYDITNYKIIYNDFKNNLLSNLIVYDESEFIISTHYNLQKLIVNSQAQFLNKTGHGIDLIIIDDFSFMKLDINRKCIINQNSIINEYYNYLKDQSLNLLGTGINIPIVITITPSRLISDTYDYDIYDLYKFIPHSLMILSDNVFIINCNDLLKKQNKCVINILKSSNGKILEQPKDINVKYQYYFMEYNKDSNTSTKILLEEKNLENQNLNHELDELKEMINDTSNTTLSEEFNLKLDL